MKVQRAVEFDSTLNYSASVGNRVAIGGREATAALRRHSAIPHVTCVDTGIEHKSCATRWCSAVQCARVRSAVLCAFKDRGGCATHKRWRREEQQPPQSTASFTNGREETFNVMSTVSVFQVSVGSVIY